MPLKDIFAFEKQVAPRKIGTSVQHLMDLFCSSLLSNE